MTRVTAWDVTSRCNLHCAHCSVGDFYHRGQPASSEVTYREGLVTLRRMHKAGYGHLRLLGGEPLMRRDIVELVAAAHQMGFPRIVIVTNGTRVTLQLFDALLKAGLDDFVVSLDGATAQSHDQIRGQGTYAQAMRGLETMLRRRPADSKLKIAAQLTLSRPNVHETATMVELVGQMGLDYLRINELKLVGNARRHRERLLPSLVEAMDARESALQAASRYPDLGLQAFGRPRVIAYFNERFGRGLPIVMPNCSIVNRRKVHVTAYGFVSACSAAEAEDASDAPGQGALGGVEHYRLHTHSLSSILASPRFERVKRLVNRALEEGWQDEFIPCVRCHYRPACQLCPLFLREQKDKMVRECLLAIQRLARWRKSRRQAKEVSHPVAPDERRQCHV